jgi:hypothetical protein
MLAQGLAPIIRTELDTFEITVGDPLALTVAVEHDVGSSVVWPDSIDLGSVELLDAVVLEPVHQANRQISAARFVVTAFELGDLEIPSFDVAVVGADTTVLASDEWNVTVVSVGRDESGDIRDIKGPLDIPRNWLLLIPWILAVIVLSFVGRWVYKRYRGSKTRSEKVVPTSPTKPPHEIAYEALDRLAASGLLEQGNVKQYHIEVSDIIRRYIEGRYRVAALEMVTYEVLLGLEDVGLAFDTRLEFERFLGDCDLVKFAKLRPEIAGCREMIPRARWIVDETREGDTEGEGGEGDLAVSSVRAVPTASSAPSPGREGGGA